MKAKHRDLTHSLTARLVTIPASPSLAPPTRHSRDLNTYPPPGARKRSWYEVRACQSQSVSLTVVGSPSLPRNQEPRFSLLQRMALMQGFAGEFSSVLAVLSLAPAQQAASSFPSHDAGVQVLRRQLEFASIRRAHAIAMLRHFPCSPGNLPCSELQRPVCVIKTVAQYLRRVLMLTVIVHRGSL